MRRILLSIAAVATAFAAALGVTQASALPVAPKPAPPVAGIPTPCAAQHPWPKDASISQIKQQMEDNFHLKLVGSYWSDEYRPSIKIMWETLDAVSCTGYVQTLLEKNNGNVGISANDTRSWAWGDWSLTKPGYVTLDFQKFKTALDNGDEGRLVRLVIHELGHAWNSDRGSSPAYWQAFQRLERTQPTFSKYAGSSVTETFADTVGYYVGRCALNNPYDTGKFDAYYEFVKTNVFNGKEFGPAPGEKPNCTVPKQGAEEPRPGKPTDGDAKPIDVEAQWLSDLAGE